MKIARYFLSGFLILLFILFIGGAMAIYGNTLISPWIPLSVAVVVAVASGVRCWRWWASLTRTGNRPFNFFIHTAFTTALLVFAFYFTNSFFARKDTEHVEQAVVESRYSETHYRSRRVGRNRYTRGEPYQVYYMEVAFPGGVRKRLSLRFDEYRYIRKGDTLKLRLEKGMWGVPVVRRDGLHVEIPESRR